MKANYVNNYGEENREYNKDGGNGCSNPNWGTGNRGDSNPDTQKELTVLQKREKVKQSQSSGRVNRGINPLDHSEYFASLLPCSKCKLGILVPETEEKEMSMEKKKKLKCINCGGKYKLYKNGVLVSTLLPYIVIPLIRIK